MVLRSSGGSLARGELFMAEEGRVWFEVFDVVLLSVIRARTVA